MAAPDGRRLIHTAGCIIIGDEVLGGKTVDTNSAYFAKYCFSLGINLKRVEVIPDIEEDIIEAARRMSSKYDFVVTSGGIGPTHDDITYASIAKAFDLPLTLHPAAFARMRKLSRPHPSQPNFDWDTPSPALSAKKRMVELPHDAKISDEAQVIFVKDNLWVPIACVNGNIHILPGIPRLFEALLEGLKPSLQLRVADPEGGGVYRILISTPLPESAVAPALTEIAAKVESKGVKVGSYPRWGKSRNTVTLVGTDREFMDALVPEVEKSVQGRRVTIEGEDDDEKSDQDT
ncbi:Molybdopterin binding protein [Rhizodiscina lignyota]|uniref:Molybdopterin binding protein n=1 Tax=Rhizodiscina lignyota TaxID=1504668 RepID=A0A9P4MA52_9PEZI|nr:Molybdopterin binding protein [Rhizodiscina lignyota]